VKQKNSVEPDMTLLSSDGPEKGLYVLVAVGSSGILKGKQKLFVNFNFDKQDFIDFTKFSKMTRCRASEANS
jgi:hypothetical protein